MLNNCDWIGAKAVLNRITPEGSRQPTASAITYYCYQDSYHNNAKDQNRSWVFGPEIVRPDLIIWDPTHSAGQSRTSH